MAKISIKIIEGKYVGFLNDSDKSLSEDNLNFLLNQMVQAKITKATLDGNNLILKIDDNDVIIEDITSFIKIDKYKDLINHIGNYVEDERKKDTERLRNKPGKKVNRNKSIKSVIKYGLAITILMGVAAYSLNKVVENLENSPKENFYKTQTYIEQPVATIDPTIPRYDYNLETKFLSKEEFDEVITSYAKEVGVKSETLQWLLYNNGNHNDEALIRYKTLIDYIKYYSDMGFTIEIIKGSHNNISGILATDYSRYVIIPENIEKMDSLVELNPTATSGYLCYESILNDIRNGNIPTSIIVGTANSALDYTNPVNSNILLKTVKFSLEHNVNINNIGVLGYNNSGETAFLNLGNLLTEYPGLNARIVNLDGYYITNFIEKLNSYLNGNETENDKEIQALLNSNLEVVNIFPQTGCYGVSNERPEEALNESLYLENVFKGHHIATPVESYKDLPLQAYYSGIIRYLAGQITFEELNKLYTENIRENRTYEDIDYNGYYQSNPTYNDYSGVNDVINFGSSGEYTEGSWSNNSLDDYLGNNSDIPFDYDSTFDISSFDFGTSTESFDIPSSSIDQTSEGIVNDVISF